MTARELDLQRTIFYTIEPIDDAAHAATYSAGQKLYVSATNYVNFIFNTWIFFINIFAIYLCCERIPTSTYKKKLVFNDFTSGPYKISKAPPKPTHFVSHAVIYLPIFIKSNLGYRLGP